MTPGAGQHIMSHWRVLEVHLKHVVARGREAGHRMLGGGCGPGARAGGATSSSLKIQFDL